MKPLVSCYILSYNHEKYIDEALDGLFSQDYDNIEYLISDDNSTDNTWINIKKYLNINKNKLKNKNILLNKNDNNLGLMKHIEKVVLLTSGSILIGMPGDDISFPNRTSCIVDFFKNNNASMVFSNATIIDTKRNEYGKLFIREMKSKSIDNIINNGFVGLSGATKATKRDVYDKFGKIPLSIENEDDHLPFRAALLDGIGIIDKPLLYYRLHENSLSSWLWKKQSFREYLDRYIKNLDNRINHYIEWEKLIYKSNLSDQEELVEKINIKINKLKKEMRDSNTLYFKFRIYFNMQINILKQYVKKYV
jgi:glycosyltransferase involved in cell wall biosynthesis